VISANIKNRKGYKIEKSQMEIMTEKIREMKLQAEKKKLKEEMDKLINDFDIEVVKLSNEKNIIEGDLMIAKMKLTTFY
jgi:acetolactate synthase small subunit